MNETPDLIQFIGRFHPLLVHLPIGFLILLVTLETLAFIPRFRDANAASGYVVALLFPAALISAVCGWLLALSGDYRMPVLAVHRSLGLATLALCGMLALSHRLQWRKPYWVLLYVSAMGLAVTSHFGGSLTHGSDYLIRYAPKPIRDLLSGLNVGTPSVATGPSNDIFTLAVQPLLQARCGSCHGPDKQKGGLRLDSVEAIKRGSESGPVMVSGNARESRLVQRILLPLEHDDHMPPEGKPQLTIEEIALLRWWIDSGAFSAPSQDDLSPPQELQSAIDHWQQGLK